MTNGSLFHNFVSNEALMDNKDNNGVAEPLEQMPIFESEFVQLADLPVDDDLFSSTPYPLTLESSTPFLLPPTLGMPDPTTFASSGFTATLGKDPASLSSLQVGFPSLSAAAKYAALFPMTSISQLRPALFAFTQPKLDYQSIAAMGAQEGIPCASIDPKRTYRQALGEPQKEPGRCIPNNKRRKLQAVLQKAAEDTRPPVAVQQPNPAAQSAVHLACLQSSTTAAQLEALLVADPTAVMRSVVLRSSKNVYDYLSRSVQSKIVKEPYTYALHLAIHHQLEADAITLLILAEPSMLHVRDGEQKETPLMVLFKSNLVHSPYLVKLVDIMLKQEPKCIQARDRHQNSALHIAISRGVGALEVIRRLLLLDSTALLCKNYHGKTPVDLCQERISSCDDRVARYLQGMAAQTERSSGSKKSAAARAA